MIKGLDFSELIGSVKKIMKSVEQLNINIIIEAIDYEKISEGIKHRVKAYEDYMKIVEPDGWAIDFDMLAELEKNNININNLDDYVRNNLDDYLSFFKKEEIYNEHYQMLKSTHELYQKGYYPHCTFALFAIFEKILEDSFSDYTTRKNKRNNLYNTTTEFIEDTESELIIGLIFFRRVYNVYTLFFEPSWNKHPENINRNWVMHGKYDFSKIKEIDVLKLFQLLKALNIISDNKLVMKINNKHN